MKKRASLTCLICLFMVLGLLLNKPGIAGSYQTGINEDVLQFEGTNDVIHVDSGSISEFHTVGGGDFGKESNIANDAVDKYVREHKQELLPLYKELGGGK